MSKVNKNFLDDDTQYQDSDTEEVIEEIVEEVEEESEEASATAKVMNEAMNRIEQAKLYEALLNHQLFAPGSAKGDIVKIVCKEVKDFVQFRMEVLLGMRPDGKIGSHMQGGGQRGSAPSQFSDQQVSALRGIADKLISRGAQPTINTVSVREPQIQELTMPREPQVQEVEQDEPRQQRTVRTVTRRIIKRNGEVVSEGVTDTTPRTYPGANPQRPPVKNKPREKTNNLDPKTGQDYGQAALPSKPPVAMPSQAQMDMMNANLADKNLRGASTTGGLGQALQVMLRNGG
jgi:hypothetical protein